MLTNRQRFCSLDVLLDVDRTTRGLIVVCYPRVATRGGSAVVNWMTVVEEPAEGELIEAVVVAVDVLVALRPLFVLGPQFIRVNRVEVARVRLVLDGGLVRSLFCPQRRTEVDVGEERMRLDVVRTVLSYPAVV